jgi:hypothetical protein
VKLRKPVMRSDVLKSCRNINAKTGNNMTVIRQVKLLLCPFMLQRQEGQKKLQAHNLRGSSLPCYYLSDCPSSHNQRSNADANQPEDNEPEVLKQPGDDEVSPAGAS